MKIAIKQLEANPFRNTAAYPIDKAKVATLVKSIAATSFWDNILARPAGGKFQIAYGHHRLEALHEIYGKQSGHEVDIPVRELDDATMVKIMANENAEQWTRNNAVVLETVRAVRDFLAKHPEEEEKVRPPGGTKRGDGYTREGETVVAFLGDVYASHTVQDALAIINSIDRKEVDAEAVARIPEPTKAREFVFAVKQAAERIPARVQMELADSIVEEDVRRADIRSYVETAGYKAKKKAKAKPDVSDFMRADLGLLRKMTEHIVALVGVKEDLRGPEWLVFRNECRKLLSAVSALLEVKTLVVKSGGK